MKRSYVTIAVQNTGLVRKPIPMQWLYPTLHTAERNMDDLGFLPRMMQGKVALHH
jgi:hypothetical protein